MSSLKKGIDIAKNGLTNSKERLNAMQRIELLEENLKALVKTLNKEFEKIRNSNDENVPVINALVELVDPARVEAKVLEAKMAEYEKMAVQLETNIADQVSKGLLVPRDELSDKLFFAVTTEFDADGNVMMPRKVFLPVYQFRKEFQDKMLGLKVGDSFTTESNRTVKVVEAYELVLKKNEPESEKGGQ